MGLESSILTGHIEDKKKFWKAVHNLLGSLCKWLSEVRSDSNKQTLLRDKMEKKACSTRFKMDTAQRKTNLIVVKLIYEQNT